MKTIPTQPRTNNEPLVVPGLGEYPASHRVLDSAPGGNDGRNEDRPAFAPQTILVPLALSGSSRGALAIARNLACKYEARLVLLHVVQLNIAGGERGIQRARLLPELCRNAEFQLQQLAGYLCGPAVTDILVCEGRPAEAIVETARRLPADTIVMCTHGCRGWLKWLHRNTALNVMRQAPCTMLLISPGRRDDTVNFLVVDPLNNNSKTILGKRNTVLAVSDTTRGQCIVSTAVLNKGI
jgi:nucleotide-binding universal stress UspA family protein